MVRRFVKKVEEAALGERVVKGIAPDQKLVKVQPPFIWLVCGWCYVMVVKSGG